MFIAEFNQNTISDKELLTQLQNIDSIILEANKPFAESKYDDKIIESIRLSLEGLENLLGSENYDLESNIKNIKSEISFDKISIDKLYDSDSNRAKIHVVFDNITQDGYFALFYNDFIDIYSNNLINELNKNNIKIDSIIWEEEFGKYTLTFH